MNFTDSVVTVKWKTSEDICGSFSKYSVYGSKEGVAFLKLDDIPDISITEYPHKLNDLNTTWRYYLTIDAKCDGATLVTDTVSIDLTLPRTIQIDSLSYELSTQKIIAGWPKNPSNDTKSYVIYDGTSGNGDSIGTTMDTSYVVTNSRPGRYPVRISSTDSCNLFSLLSTTHRTAYLKSSIDTCKREISLTWDLYSGWSSIDSQSLFISRDKGVTFWKDTTVSGTLNALIFNKLTLGDTLVFFIRSYTKNGTISSSSNTNLIETRAFVVPKYVYLTLATVYDEIDNTKAMPSITWQIDNLTDISSFSVLSGTESQNMLPIASKSISKGQLEYFYDDLQKDAKTQSFTYQINAVDNCYDTIQSSEISKTIHLAIKPQIVHNEYVNWDVGVKSYLLQKHNGSTWNTLYSQSDLIQDIDFSDSSGCYQIAATEKINRFDSATTSYSNIVCLQKPLVFNIATAINTGSDNNRFIIIGEGIDHTKSHYSIFNRWGEKIVDKRTDEPWYADYKGKSVLPGSYVYIANIVGLLGQTETIKGVLNVIR